MNRIFGFYPLTRVLPLHLTKKPSNPSVALRYFQNRQDPLVRNSAKRYRQFFHSHHPGPRQSGIKTFLLGLAFLGTGVLAFLSQQEPKREPLHDAAECGDLEAIQKFLELYPKEIDKKNGRGETPLLAAIRSGQSEVLDLLLDFGADVNQSMIQNEGIIWNPLSFAVRHGQNRCIEILVQKTKINLLQKVSRVGNLLHLALREGRFDTLSYLLLRYAKMTSSLIEDRDDLGRTPFLYSCAIGDPSSAALLKRKGAQVEAQDQMGWTAAHWAVAEDQAHMLPLLAFWCVASLETPDKKGVAPLGLAYQKKKRTLEELQRCLRIQKAVDTTNLFIYSPDTLVCEGGGPRGVGFLGALEVLQKNGNLDQVECYMGTSAGAIISTLAAVGYSPPQIREILEKKDLIDFIDNDLLAAGLKRQYFQLASGLLRTAVGKLFSRNRTASSSTGICSGESFREFGEELISRKTEIPYCTFGELTELVEKHPETFKHLCIFGTAQGSIEPQMFSSNPKHYSSYKEYEKIKRLILSDGLRISMSIPFVYLMHEMYEKIDGERIKKGETKHFDGGLLANFPLAALDGWNRNRKTLGLRFLATLPKERKIENILDALWEFMAISSDAGKHLSKEDVDRVIVIDPGTVNLLSFNLSQEEIDAIVASGRKATVHFLERMAQKFEAITGEKKTVLRSRNQTLSEEKALSLLEKSTGEERSDSMRTLAQSLGYLPSALSLAAHLIVKDPQMDCRRYLEEWQKGSSSDSIEGKTAALTWRTLERISPSAAKWCKMFGVLGPHTPIMRDWADQWIGQTEDPREILQTLLELGCLSEDPVNRTFTVEISLQAAIDRSLADRSSFQEALLFTKSSGASLRKEIEQQQDHRDPIYKKNWITQALFVMQQKNFSALPQEERDSLLALHSFIQETRRTA